VRKVTQQQQRSCTDHARQTGGTRRCSSAGCGVLRAGGGNTGEGRHSEGAARAVGMRTRPHRVREPGRRQRRRNSPGTALLVAVLRRNTWTGGRPERRLERQLLGGPDDVGSLERPSTGRGATSARRWRDGHLHGKRLMKA
jgi:hypothetical protein